MVKKMHLAVKDAAEKIQKLEIELNKPETINNKTKKKRLYSQLAQLKKAIDNPDELLVDPEAEALKIQQDKQKRINKKIEKKRELILSKKKENRYKKRCLKCGSREHLLGDCTNAAVEPIKQKKSKKAEKSAAPVQKQIPQNQSGGFCYKCGSTEHSHKECAETEYKLALCFYCGNKGHIARECPKNQKGLYRKGGSCFGCGSVRHTLKDCPVRHSGKQGKFSNKEQF